MTPLQPADPATNLTTFSETLAQQFADAERYPSEPRDYSATRGPGFAVKLETGEQFYERVLADGLKFRRAGGPPPIDKTTFLKGLTNSDNTTDAIDVSNIEVIPYGANLVMVALVVTLTGRRGGNAIMGGRYRNVRVFARETEEWRCVLWFNEPA